MERRLTGCELALTDPDEDAAIRAAVRYLRQMTDLLRDAVGDPDLDGASAQRLERLRDDVSGYLLAVEDLEAVAIQPVTVLGVLRQAAVVARMGVAAPRQ